MLQEKEIKRIARLSRFDLSEKETAGYREDFSLVLNYVEKIKKMKTSDSDLSGRVFKIKNVMRPDRPAEFSPADREKLMQLAPQTEKNYLKVNLIKEDWS